MVDKPSMKRMTMVMVMAAVFVLFAGYMIVHKWGGTKPLPGPAADKAVPVQVMMIRPRNVPVVVDAVGRLFPERTVTLSAQVPGQVSGYDGDVGKQVAKGDILVRVKPRDYELALSEARGNLAAAQARLAAVRNAHDRFEKLLPRKVVSQDHFDKVEAEYKTALAQEAQAKAGVAIAEERLQKTGITAPFSGSIAVRHVEIGQMISVNEPVMTLIDLRQVRLKVFIAEKDFIHVDPSDAAEVTVEAYPDQTFRGRIDRMDVKADAATNTFGVEIVIDNAQRLLKAGLSARVRLTVDTIPDALMIPQHAVLFREKGTEVFVVENEKTAQPRSVEMGMTQGDLVRIVKGLRAGDRLIIKGQNYVKPGTQIIIAPET